MIFAALVTTSLPARGDGREELNACQVMMDRVTQPPQAGTATTRPDDTTLQRCRQIVRDWTLRESRMSVDEHGRPLR
jgi:hypothetical protein